MPALAEEGGPPKRPPPPPTTGSDPPQLPAPQPPDLQPAANLLTQSFDGTTFPPTGWTIQDSKPSPTWARLPAGVSIPANALPSPAPHSGVGEAMFNAFSSGCPYPQQADPSMSNLVTPLLNFANGSSHQISFWMQHTEPYSRDAVCVMVRRSSADPWESLNRCFFRNDGPTGWQQHTVSLSAYDGEPQIYVALSVSFVQPEAES